LANEAGVLEDESGLDRLIQLMVDRKWFSEGINMVSKRMIITASEAYPAGSIAFSMVITNLMRLPWSVGSD
jgi:hypothetical protein